MAFTNNLKIVMKKKKKRKSEDNKNKVKSRSGYAQRQPGLRKNRGGYSIEIKVEDVSIRGK